jgi:hypothetical protein
MITPEGADTWASGLRSDVKLSMVDTVAEAAWRRKGGGKERPGRKKDWGKGGRRGEERTG